MNDLTPKMQTKYFCDCNLTSSNPHTISSGFCQRVKNPFIDRLKTHFPDFGSPSVFQEQSTPCSNCPAGFKWSIDQLSLLRPVDIDPFPNQETVDNNYFRTPRRLDHSKFFSNHSTIPSLLSPWMCIANNQPTLRDEGSIENTPFAFTSPSYLCTHLPPECLHIDSHKVISANPVLPQPSSDLIPVNNRTNDEQNKSNEKVTFSDKSTSFTNYHSSLEECGVRTLSTQTLLSLPMEFDLEKALGRYAFYQGEHTIGPTTLRRSLFANTEKNSSHAGTEEDKVSICHSAPPSVSKPEYITAGNRSSLMESTPLSTKHNKSKCNSNSKSAKSLLLSFTDTPKSSRVAGGIFSRMANKRVLKCSLQNTPIINSLKNSLDISCTPVTGTLQCSTLQTPEGADPLISPICPSNDNNDIYSDTDDIDCDFHSDECAKQKNVPITPIKIPQSLSAPSYKSSNYNLIDPPTHFCISPISYKAPTQFQAKSTLYKSTSTPFFRPKPSKLTQNSHSNCHTPETVLQESTIFTHDFFADKPEVSFPINEISNFDSQSRPHTSSCSSTKSNSNSSNFSIKERSSIAPLSSLANIMATQSLNSYDSCLDNMLNMDSTQFQTNLTYTPAVVPVRDASSGYESHLSTIKETEISANHTPQFDSSDPKFGKRHILSSENRSKFAFNRQIKNINFKRISNLATKEFGHSLNSLGSPPILQESKRLQFDSGKAQNINSENIALYQEHLGYTNNNNNSNNINNNNNNAELLDSNSLDMQAKHIETLERIKNYVTENVTRRQLVRLASLSPQASTKHYSLKDVSNSFSSI